jgi:L-seryl-tRNA(Ser) seleniumtransferase
MKVGKEEMMGLLAAVERYLNLDHESLLQTYEKRVQFWISGLDGKKGILAQRDYPNEAGQPVPRTRVELPVEVPKEEVIDALMKGEPRVAVAPSENGNALLLNPMTVIDGESEIVLERLLQVLG